MGNLSTSKSITFLDIETSGLKPERSCILQICFITDWEDGKQEIFETKIKPNKIELEFASEESLKIVNYSDEAWKDAPTFQDVAPTIAKKLTWGPLVGHNINFDLAHIRSTFKRYKWEEVDDLKMLDKDKKFKIGYPIIDTCALSYLFLPTERQNLNEVRKYYNISEEGSHNALKDTEDCRQIFYNIINQKYQ